MFSLIQRSLANLTAKFLKTVGERKVLFVTQDLLRAYLGLPYRYYPRYLPISFGTVTVTDANDVFTK
jgi:hypothetical protein